MDVKFLNCPTTMPQEPQIDWMELAAQMAMQKPPPSLSGSSLSSAYNSPPTPASPPFSTPPLSRPPSNPNHASATTEPLFAAGQYFYIPTDGWEPAEAMREMIFCIAAMQPVHIDPESVKPPKRRNVRVSKDPQSVAARLRRERISERIRILQRLVPGGTRMDTASMLDEAIHYVKFLKMQLQSLERAANGFPPEAAGAAFASGNYGWVALDQGYSQVEEPRNGFQC